MKIAVEYGHVYFASGPHILGPPKNDVSADDISRSLTPEEEASRTAGILTRDLLVNHEHDVSTYVMVDDVAVFHRHLQAARRYHSAWRYEFVRARFKQAAQLLFGSDYVVSEGDLYQPALRTLDGIITAAVNNDLAANGNRISVPTANGIVKVKIKGFRGIEDPSWPSCEVLDLTFQLERVRSSNFDAILTVLSEDYVAQQERVHALATLMGDPLLSKVGNATLFVNSTGNITSMRRWNSPSEEVSKAFDSLERTLVVAPDFLH